MMATALLVIAMIGATALAIGGVALVRNRTEAPRGWLMIAAATVLIGNVLILTV